MATLAAREPAGVVMKSRRLRRAFRRPWRRLYRVGRVLLLLGAVTAQGLIGVGHGQSGMEPPAFDPAAFAASSAQALASRARTFEATVDLFKDRYWDPNYRDWQAWADGHRQAASQALERVVFDAVMRQMISELRDDHSRWLGLASPPPDPLGAAGERNVAPGLGFGLQVRYLSGWGLLIERVLPDSPAQRAGLLRADVVVALDDIDLTTVEVREMRELLDVALHQPQAKLVVKRGSRRLAPLVLSAVPLAEDDLALRPYAVMLASGAGYLYLPSFTQSGTAARAHLALAELTAAGASGVVIDLRGNLGGSVSELGAFLGAFLSGEWGEAEGRGQRLWRASFDEESSSARLVAQDGKVQRSLALAAPTKFAAPVAVLVDAETGSAAEVAAFVLAERAGAVVVGEPTHGNVEVVQSFRLPDGSAVLIAIGNMRLPGGVSMDAGITPEVLSSVDILELAAGLDAPVAAAEGQLSGLPFVPGKWLR